jgi:hypothetical protein
MASDRWVPWQSGRSRLAAVSQAEEPLRFAPLTSSEATVGVIVAPGDENWSNQFSGYGVSDTVNAMVIDGSDNLYLGSNFTSAGGTVNRVTRWDGTAWFPLGSAMNGTVRALARMPAAASYAGGEFTNAGGVSATRIAGWDGTAGLRWAAGPGGTVRSGARRKRQPVCWWRLHQRRGVSASRVAKWNGPPGRAGRWPGWHRRSPGMGQQQRQAHRRRLVRKSGSTQVNRVARWNGTKLVGFWQWDQRGNLRPGVDNSSTLYAGGWFTAAGGVAQTM